jgi:hypothetical protein
LKSLEDASQESHWQKHEVQLSTCAVLVCLWSASGVGKVARQRRPGACCLSEELVIGVPGGILYAVFCEWSLVGTKCCVYNQAYVPFADTLLCV